MRPSPDPRIRDTNWLKYRWPFEVFELRMAGSHSFYVRVGRLDVSRHDTRDQALGWIWRTKPVSLAQAVYDNPEFRGSLAFIEGSQGRLAHIPQRLWDTYDAIVIGRCASALTILSAKARAFFPRDERPGIFVRVRPLYGPGIRRY